MKRNKYIELVDSSRAEIVPLLMIIIIIIIVHTAWSRLAMTGAGIKIQTQTRRNL